jgi:hypothetical protein
MNFVVVDVVVFAAAVVVVFVEIDVVVIPAAFLILMVLVVRNPIVDGISY